MVGYIPGILIQVRGHCVNRQTNCVPALRFPFSDYVAEKRRVN